ncbi:MAG: D-alanyl-D-alanine carboxypeptidase/D-alanyl-D-alanine-endopeptidase [Planctomycetota bacterium]
MAAWLVALALLATGDIAGELEQAVQNGKVPRSRVGILVGRPGQPAFALAADRARIPASNQKIITAATALLRLGADYRFETRIVKLPGGHLGVIGGGDPNLSGRFFDGDASTVLRHLARQVKAKGVEEITGDLVLDASRFDGVTIHPGWPSDQLDRWYCAPVAALIYNDSCWDVTVQPGTGLGATARVEWRPTLLRPRLQNNCDTVASSKQHVVHIGRTAESDLLVRGGILSTSAGIEKSVPVHEPVMFFGRAFRAALESEGVRVAGQTRVGAATGGETLTVFRSGLGRTIKVALTNSQNLYSECLFRIQGKGSFESAAQAVRKTLVAEDVSVEGLVVSDGSGLARANKVTPRTIFEILTRMDENTAFIEGLAAGGEGTLRRRFRALGERVRLKTGTLRGVSALSGYVTDAGGKVWIMSVLCETGDRGSAIRLQNSVVAVLARQP